MRIMNDDHTHYSLTLPIYVLSLKAGLIILIRDKINEIT